MYSACLSLGFPQRVMVLVNHLTKAFGNLNLFKEQCSRSRMQDAEALGTKSTRIYVVLLFASVFVLGLFNSLNEIVVFETVTRPSISHYELLQASLTKSITCPCDQIGIPYGTFLNTVPRVHQVSLYQ